MNLTSKRMLQFLSVCAGAFALTAAAQTTWVSDSFEADAGVMNSQIGNAAGMYKAYVSTMPPFTNFAWKAEAGDASTIQAFEGDFPYGHRPITDQTEPSQALKLETEGTTLTRYVAFTEPDEEDGRTHPTSTSFQDTPVYVDTLIKFTPSEDDPEITADGFNKLAVFVNASSNLVVCHKYRDMGVEAFMPTNSVFTQLGEINPEQWHRLTIMLAYNKTADTTFYVPAFEIYFDGIKLTHPNGAQNSNPGVYTDGSWFFALSAGAYYGGDITLSEVSFQGTGYVDDLVVTQIAPHFAEPAGIPLTLVFNDDWLNVMANGASVVSNGTVTSGTTLTITAEDWYQITSVGGTGITWEGTDPEWDGTTPLGEKITSASGTITASGADLTATIGAGLYYTGEMPTGHNYQGQDAAKVTAWAIANNLSMADLNATGADAYVDNYLLNVGTNATAQIEIASIVYTPAAGADPATATITVKAVNAADGVNFNRLNGTLAVQTTSDLTTGFTDAETQYFDIDEMNSTDTLVTIDVTVPNGNFIRACVK